ncbi:MAG: tetratricopeptide repeat protein, partial [Bdellovibrionales bacterium]|nr:tetratricopeptide repeat protein [Bdellovibrionales bacterium]
MKAKSLLALVFLLTISMESSARVTDPNVIVEESRIKVENMVVAEKAAPKEKASIFNKVSSTLKGFWNSTKEALTGDKKSKASKTAATSLKKPSPKVEADLKQRQVEQLTQQMPTYQAEKKTVSPEKLTEAKKALAPGLTRIVEDRRPAQADIKTDKAGVPTFPVFKEEKTKGKDGKVKVVYQPIDKIPRLNIGKEARISKNDFVLPQFNFQMAKYEEAKPLKSPDRIAQAEVLKVVGKKLPPAPPVKDLGKLAQNLKKPITKKDVDGLKWKTHKEITVALKPYDPLTEAEQKMLAALVLYQRGGKCSLVMGLFQEISEGKALKDEALFHLGSCAHRMDLYSSAYKTLSKLIKKQDTDYTSDALGVLSQKMPLRFEEPFYQLVSSINASKWIKSEFKSELSYRVAKGAFKLGKTKEAAEWIKGVSEKSDYYPSSQYLLALTYHSQGNQQTALNKMEGLLAFMEKKKIDDKNLRSLIHLNLARMNFNQGDYSGAMEHFKKVDKDHPTWVQALVEQGWAQLAMEDYAGAIGNMYSLHSPYFTAVYKPESFAVRAIGYLNICQYGDAYRTLTKLEQDYREWNKETQSYISSHSKNSGYYETVISYLK